MEQEEQKEPKEPKGIRKIRIKSIGSDVTDQNHDTILQGGKYASLFRTASGPLF